MDRVQDEQQDLDENGDLVNREQHLFGDEERDENAEESDVDENVTNLWGLKQRPARALDNCAAFIRGMTLYILYHWEVAESQQLLSSCLQRLSDRANATDASSAALVTRKGGTASVGSNITSRSGGSTRSGSRCTRRRNSDDETDDDEVTNATKNQLVQSLQDLVDSQRNLLSDRALDREHQERENSWTRHFDRHSSLVDEARTYRIKIAEFRCVDDKCSRRMQQFYSSELSKLEEEILQLDER
jgi:hypothetical protein